MTTLTWRAGIGMVLATALTTTITTTVLAQPMAPAVTTRTVTTVTTTRQAPPVGEFGMGGEDMSRPESGRVMYDGQPADGAPGPAGWGYPQTEVWRATPQDFPHDWTPGRPAVHHTRVRRHAPIHQVREARHPRRDYVEINSHGQPVPVIVQVTAPDGYRDTVPAVIRPSGVPTVVRPTGENPPPVMYSVAPHDRSGWGGGGYDAPPPGQGYGPEDEQDYGYGR